MREEIIMGVDPGLSTTGYGILARGSSGLKVIDFGCIRPPVKEQRYTRYKIIYEAIAALVKKFAPQALAIETQFVHPKNPTVAITLGMARGVITLAASLAGMEIFEYPPKTVKIAATGRGNASKQQMQFMIQQRFGLKELPQPEDAADALALALCHSHAPRII